MVAFGNPGSRHGKIIRKWPDNEVNMVLSNQLLVIRKGLLGFTGIIYNVEPHLAPKEAAILVGEVCPEFIPSLHRLCIVGKVPGQRE